MNNGNAALEILQGAGFELAPEPMVAPDTTENVAGNSRRGLRRVMVYMPVRVARKFREIALSDDRKANDLYLEALDDYLRKWGHGGIKGVVER
jgi:hypothetical protein